jgi:hypothetical protein
LWCTAAPSGTVLAAPRPSEGDRRGVGGTGSAGVGGAGSGSAIVPVRVAPARVGDGPDGASWPRVVARRPRFVVDPGLASATTRGDARRDPAAGGFTAIDAAGVSAAGASTPDLCAVRLGVADAGVVAGGAGFDPTDVDAAVRGAGFDAAGFDAGFATDRFDAAGFAADVDVGLGGALDAADVDARLDGALDAADLGWAAASTPAFRVRGRFPPGVADAPVSCAAFPAAVRPPAARPVAVRIRVGRSGFVIGAGSSIGAGSPIGADAGADGALGAGAGGDSAVARDATGTAVGSATRGTGGQTGAGGQLGFGGPTTVGGGSGARWNGTSTGSGTAGPNGVVDTAGSVATASASRTGAVGPAEPTGAGYGRTTGIDHDLVSRRPPSARDIPDVERAPTRSPMVIGRACALPRTVSSTGSSAISAGRVGAGSRGDGETPRADGVLVTLRRTGSKAGSKTSVTAVMRMTTTVAAVGDHRCR